MRFRDIQHQDRALSILRRALRSGRTHHAYLFEGPEGVGKELAAQALAARLLCEDDGRAPDDDACGRCTACHMLAHDSHPDFHLVHRGLNKVHPDRTVRASRGLYLVVDLVRYFVIDPANLTPTHGRRRVFVIRDAERMNEDAQNALLKTLEEPPGSAVLILVTSSASRLLATIRSRCQRVPFGYLPPAFVAERLRAGGAGIADATALAGLAEGRLGVALRWQKAGVLEALEAAGGLLDGLATADPESFGKAAVEVAAELALRLRPVNGGDEGASADELDDDEPSGRGRGAKVPTDELRDALKLVLALFAALYREALLLQSGAGELGRLPGQRPRAERLAKLAPTRLDPSVNALNEAERMLDRNVAPQLVCERLAVALLGELPIVA